MSSSQAIMKRHGFRYRHLREDPNTGLHIATIRCFSGSGKKVIIELAPSILSQKNQLLARLRDIDAVLPDNASELEKLLQAIATVGPDKRERYAKSNGWSDDGTYFVIGKYIIGKAPQGQLGVRKPPGSSGEPGQLRVNGTASGWKNTVGKYALASSTAMLAVCAALAAPLLTFMGQTSFGYCFCSKTRSGKSLASWIGASLVGIKSMEEFLTWYSSTTSVEERLPEYCDMMATIDDISTMRGTQRAKFQRATDFAYELGTNQGRGRSRIHKVATGTAHLWHRTIVLTSAETSLSEMARSLGDERQGGDTVRMIDLPANAEGHEDVFDRLDIVDPVARADAVQKLIKAIAKDASRNYGKAFHKYVEKLIAMRGEIKQTVEGLVSDFIGQVVLSHDSRKVIDIARNFGLLYAGGVLGVRLEILPWSEDDVLSAVTTCFGRARNLIVDDAKLLRDGLELLNEYLKNLPELKTDRLGCDTIDGYHERKKGLDVFTIKVDAFNRALPIVPQRTLVRNWLLQNGYLEVREIRGLNGTRQLQPREQCPWPDGERRRSFRIKGTPRLKVA